MHKISPLVVSVVCALICACSQGGAVAAKNIGLAVSHAEGLTAFERKMLLEATTALPPSVEYTADDAATRMLQQIKRMKPSAQVDLAAGTVTLGAADTDGRIIDVRRLVAASAATTAVGGGYAVGDPSLSEPQQ